jgi:DNA-binding CsgD family transcriptional regulator/tetratricopeptide (TPR) repeat protein
LVGREAEVGELRALLAAGRRPRRSGAPPPTPRGVALLGEAGVGKTRLMTEAVAGEEAAGASVEWVRATEAARHITLGSFAHLLAPGDEAHQRDDLLHLALARLRERAGDAPFLLAVDDAHLLDDVSVAVLHLVVTQSPIRVLASVRTGERLPPGLAALWKDELLARLDVGPLDRDATEALVIEVLGAEAPATLLDRTWRLSRGNALFVREMVRAAVERQAVGGGGQLMLSPGEPRARLSELVEERLRLLAPGPRAALDVVALGEQVPLVAAERLASPADIEELEARGLVQLVGADEQDVQVAHPLYGEVLAAALPRLRRRALLRQLVEAVDGLDGFDRLRVATWRLDSAEPGDPDQLLPLAREALGRLDHRLAERLARAAGGTTRADAGLVLGEALSGEGRVEEALAALASLRPEQPELVARVAIAQANELFLHLDRSQQGFEVLKAADAELAGHPRWQAECRSVTAQMLMFALRLPEAGALADELLASPDADEPTRLRAATVAVTAWGAQGRVIDALGLLDDDLHASAARHRRQVPFGDLQLRMARFQTLYWAGDALALDEFTRSGLGMRLADPPPSLTGILAGFRGGALLARGQARRALAELQRASRLLAESDWFGQRPLAEAIRARAAVFAGELDVADEAVAAADAAFAADPLRGARTYPYIELSRAWALAARGSRGDAAERCVDLGTAMEHVAKPLAIEVLHAAARLGRAADVVEALRRLGAAVQGPMAPVVAGHVAALVAGDADGLAASSSKFEAVGADLLAAEAARSAANAHQRSGRGASASTAAARAEALLVRCGHPRSPALEPLSGSGEELTGREREVATLAAGGRTSAEIADALFLSVRTVDTHLGRVYRKLRIDGRHELAAVLDSPTSGSRADHST